MTVDKQKVLQDAPAVLNKPDQLWQVEVQGDSIIGHWKWMDANFISLHEVTDEVREYSFTATLDDKGKWKELDKTSEKAKAVTANVKDGKIGFGTSKDTFAGKKTQKSFQVGIGKDKTDGSLGVVVAKLDTTLVKEPIRAYLTSCGWKKAGMFG